MKPFIKPQDFFGTLYGIRPKDSKRVNIPVRVENDNDWTYIILNDGKKRWISVF